MERAGLTGEEFSSHSFRHTFASLLIVGLGPDPVQVSKQLGHSRPSVTLDTYSHLFGDRHAAGLRSALGDGFGHLLAAGERLADH